MAGAVELRMDTEAKRVRAWAGGQEIGGVTVVPVRFDWGEGTEVPMGGIAAVGPEAARLLCFGLFCLVSAAAVLGRRGPAAA